MRGECVFTDDMEHCFFCFHKAHGVHHLIFGSSNRDKCDEDGIYVPICDECHTFGHLDDKRGLGFSKESRIHDNIMAEDESKMLGQVMWMLCKVTTKKQREELKTEFRKVYGQSYI